VRWSCAEKYEVSERIAPVLGRAKDTSYPIPDREECADGAIVALASEYGRSATANHELLQRAGAGSKDRVQRIWRPGVESTQKQRPEGGCG